MASAWVLPVTARAEEPDAAAAPATVAIADAALSACVGEATAGDFTVDALAALDELTCDAGEDAPLLVTSTVGLEALTGLETLSLTGYTFEAADSTGESAGASALPVWETLTSLTLAEATRLPATLEFPALTELHLTGGTFTKVPSLALLPSLTLVDLTDSAVGADALVDAPAGVRVVPEATAVADAAAPASAVTEEPSLLPAARSASVPVVTAAAAEPAPTDVMPDGPLKTCTRLANPTYEQTSKITTLSVTGGAVGCLRVTEMSWVGAEFLPNLTTITIGLITPIDHALPEEGLTTLFPNLTRITLTRVPAASGSLGDLAKVTSLAWNYTDLTAVPDLSGADELTTLTLGVNTITDFSGLSGLPKLSSLFLSNNSATSLAGIQDLPELTTLSVSSNQLTRLEVGPGMPKLQSLDVSGNQIASIGDLSGLTALETLSLSSNQLTSAAGISNLPALTTLGLGNNPLTDVSGLRDLPRLGSLTLDGTALTVLELGTGLDALSTLSVKGAQLTSVGDLTVLPRLTTLTLSGNQLTTVPGRLPASLVSLDLSTNQIAAVGDLTGLSALATLTLTQNQVAEFPTRLPASLTTLALGTNLLTAVPDGLASPSLGSLTLTDNQIATVGDLTGLTSLAQLQLGTNALTQFPTALPASLATLVLDQNKVTALPEHLDLPRLTTLSASDNAITVLQIPTPSLTTLTLSNNAIADFSVMATSYPAGMRLTAGGQMITIAEPIQAGVGHPLSDLVVFPEGLSATWTAGVENMAAVNGETGTFAAATVGHWKTTFRFSGTYGTGRVTITGEVGGTATGETSVGVYLQDVTVDEGDSATLTPTLQGFPEGVTYQWYAGTSEGSQRVIAGAVDATFTTEALTATTTQVYYKLVVSTPFGAIESAVVRVYVRPTLADAGMAACLADQYGVGFTTADLAAVPGVLDCSGYGIADLSDLSLIGLTVPIDLSDNLITDVAPLAALRTRTGVTDLSGNLIADVSAWAGQRPRGNVVLDRNRIADVSPLATVTDSRGDKSTPLFSVADQRVGLAGVAVGEDVTLPAATSVDGTVLPLASGGVLLTGTTVAFADPGIALLAWETTASTPWVEFSGAFVVPVAVTGATLDASPVAVVGGHATTVTGVGFAPDEAVSLTWPDGTLAATSRADATGQFTASVLAPYVTGDQELTARDQTSTATVTLAVTDDVIVDMPDPALLACVNAALRLPADATPYATRLAQIVDRNGSALSCRNAGITDARGLEALAVASIDLTGNEIADASLVPTLNEQTTTLSLAENLLTTLTGLAPQPHLSGTLTLSGNRITDFSALDAAELPEQAKVEALDQRILLPFQFVGRPMAEPTITGLGGEPVTFSYPAGVEPVDGQITWTAAEDYAITFLQIAGTLKVGGTITVPVLDQGEARVTISPTIAYPTWKVHLVASGFAPGESVVASLEPGGIAIGAAVADSLGVISIDTFTVPADLGAGAYTVRVSGASTTVETALQVLGYPGDDSSAASDPDPDTSSGGGGGATTTAGTSGGSRSTTTTSTTTERFYAPVLAADQIPLATFTLTETAESPVATAPQGSDTTPEPRADTTTQLWFFLLLAAAMLASGVGARAVVKGKQA